MNYMEKEGYFLAKPIAVCNAKMQLWLIFIKSL